MATTGSHKSKRRHTEPTQSNDHAARRAKKEVLQDAHAFNQERFRFYSAEADPYRPNHWRLCGYDRPLALSEQDKAQQLTLLDDNAVLVGSKGYCSARAGLGVAHGCWYWEVEVLPRATPLAPNYPEGHVRVGWSQGGCTCSDAPALVHKTSDIRFHLTRRIFWHCTCLALGCGLIGDVQYPCGFDGLSFSWRDKDGACFHRGRGDKTRLGEQGAFGPGDVLGLAIELPGQESLLDLSPAPPEAEAVDLKGLAYLETTLVTRVDEVCVGSRMMCYKNGQLLGSMALDVPKGRYYPTVSLYFNSQVRVNFGPKLRYPPTDGRFRPLAEFVPRYNAGLALFDAVQEAVNRVDQTASTAAAPTPVPARPAPLTKPA
ncbi:uncharacterized protein MONBRDRAFT_13024 [Monosiga brevicollis MX1]|uniref:SPRY domain-containing protein n=1 Tax=Monosiga brevicollis TaxID=81824 RepID=A9VE24_MONBE|nr:uncharacterized protein MONBRDRAFT_13024 [Monosiga brevicollis MX1]EDQ84234.1 predicted protein [Monosiga brevicollis MX1]|eukprot:XP_001750958.1 hypothetical protein [Monosiga brevicollis MX1]